MKDFKYIMIFEDGSISKSKEITQDDLQNSEDGILTIIDITNLKELDVNGEWQDIKSFN